MAEAIFAILGIIILGFIVWWTDRVKKHYRNRDYYDG